MIVGFTIAGHSEFYKPIIKKEFWPLLQAMGGSKG